MKRKALFIGVNEYKDSEIRNLSCSLRDAMSMHDIFEELGYQTDLLENPSKGDVFQTVRKMTSDMVGGDQFLFYFAGHGFTDSGQHLLFCADDMHEHLRFHRAGIPFDLLELETRNGGYDRVFLLDACQSDFLTGTRGNDATTRDMVAIGNMVPSAEVAPGAFYVLRSCSKYEHALEIESRKHGLFTLAMISVLRQSKHEGLELRFDDTLRETVRESMWGIASSEGISAKQTPESDGRGARQVLMCGFRPVQIRAQSEEPMSAPEKPACVVCPLCGKHNDIKDTFNCQVCGRDHLCLSHQSKYYYCCPSCAEKKVVEKVKVVELSSWLKEADRLYKDGQLSKAVVLYEQCASADSARAQNNLGSLYARGLGVAQDYAKAVKWYRRAAEQGYNTAQFNLGSLYEKGKGVAKDYAEAAKWYRFAADQGYVGAQYSLGFLYARGQGVAQDYAEAAKWYRFAADQGHADAQYCLGFLYVRGQGVAQDYAEALKWYRKAAEHGNAEAQYDLGELYSEGRGIPQDYTEAIMWYRKSAEQGNVTAQCMLGGMYHRGQGVSQDYVEAAIWYRKAAEQGDPTAQFNLSICYDKGRGVPQDYAEALKWCRKSADQGCAAAQCKIGGAYSFGHGVAQNHAEAVIWYRKAAEQGYAIAQFNLGVCYEKGQGVEQDDDEAVKWYRKAAEQGHAHAQSNLGWMYLHGHGVAQSDADAVTWYRKAAEQGDADAQINLGWMYQYGRGVAQSDADALLWYQKAAEQGSEDAKQRLLKFRAQMSSSAVADEQTYYDVILKSFGSNKISVIATIREITGLGLADAKEMVECAPRLVRERVSKENAEDVAGQLRRVGAEVEVRRWGEPAMKKFVCPMCGYADVGQTAPKRCPQCGMPGPRFKEVDVAVE